MTTTSKSKTPEPKKVPIPGFPRYFATERGEILSVARGAMRKLVGGVDKDGYRKVILCDNGIRHYKRVHALIALAYHGQPPPDMVVCHLDGDLKNNAAQNIAYVSQRENIGHKRLHGTMMRGAAHCRAKLTDEAVREIICDPRPARIVARDHGVTKGAVDGIRYGRTWKHLTREKAHG
jgi:hypothetical protein